MSSSMLARTATRSPRLVLLALIIAPALAFFLGVPGRPAEASLTSSKCPAECKYAEFQVEYVDYAGYIEVNVARVKGSIGGTYPNSGFKSWQRNIAALWRQDPGSGAWYNLYNSPPDVNAPSPVSTYSDPPWYTNGQAISVDYNFGTYWVSDWADVQMKNRFQQLPGYTPVVVCSSVVDFFF